MLRNGANAACCAGHAVLSLPNVAENRFGGVTISASELTPGRYGLIARGGSDIGALGEAIVFLTDVEGVYRAYPDPSSLAPHLTRAEVEGGIEAGWIAGGMIPKVRAALDALGAGAPYAVIASGMTVGVLAVAARGEAGTRITP